MSGAEKVALIVGLGVLVLMVKRAASPVVSKMAEAIKAFEGWAPGSRSYRNNNPGNLRPVGFSYDGQIGLDEQGHAIFDTYESGWSALLRQLDLAFSGQSAFYGPSMTLYEFFARYAEGNQRPYAEFVAAQLGVSPETTLGALQG